MGIGQMGRVRGGRRRVENAERGIKGGRRGVKGAGRGIGDVGRRVESAGRGIKGGAMRRAVIGGIAVVALVLVSVRCVGQQVEEPERSTAAISPLGVALPLYDSERSSSSEPNSGEPAPIAPLLRGVLAPTPQPAKRRRFQGSADTRNEIGIFTVANFNPETNIRIQNTPHLAVSSNKSSVGGSVEYRHWISNRTAFGLLYAQNSSDGKLLWQARNYIWPQMRSDLSVLATERFPFRRITPFLSGGPGVVITNGYANSGWSGGFALVTGTGVDFQIGRFTARTGIVFLGTRSGCYDDPTCHETWGVAEDARVGLVYRWGEERGR